MGTQIYQHTGHNPFNWYLQAELRLITAYWEGMTQKFVTNFLFDNQYPTVDQAL
jgi:hypothetical protein